MTLRAFAVVGVLTAGPLVTACSQTQAPLSSPTTPSTQDGNSSSDVRPPQAPQPDPPPPTATCTASRAEWTVGQRASTTLLERARQDAGASIARFIRPDEAITMEYHHSRLNLYLDERELVRSAVCG